jgi:hypothetical protein
MTDDSSLRGFRSGGRMAGAMLMGAIGLVFGLAIIGVTAYVAIGFLAQGPVPMAAVVYLGITVPIMLLGGFVAFQAMKVPITLWRDRRTPLPVIDGTPIVFARKQPRRLWRSLAYGAILAIGLFNFLPKLAQVGKLPLHVYFPFAFITLALLIALARVWFPPRLYWEPILLDGEGIDDRSLGRGKVPWRNVLEVSIGALGTGNGTLLKLAEPPQRQSGITILDTGFLSLLDRLTQGRRHLLVRKHGLELHHERMFRLIHAYWRHSAGGASAAVTRSAQ